MLTRRFFSNGRAVGAQVLLDKNEIKLMFGSHCLMFDQVLIGHLPLSQADSPQDPQQMVDTFAKLDEAAGFLQDSRLLDIV